MAAGTTNQPTNEWVLVLQGATKIEFEDETAKMGPGDYVDIPAHTKHRVAWTTPDEPTICSLCITAVRNRGAELRTFSSLENAADDGAKRVSE